MADVPQEAQDMMDALIKKMIVGFYEGLREPGGSAQTMLVSLQGRLLEGSRLAADAAFREHGKEFVRKAVLETLDRLMQLEK